MKWYRSNPVFPVADVAASIEWYRKHLAFVPTVINPAEGAPVYATLWRDQVSVHLLRSDQAPHGLRSPVQAQFWVESGLDELFQQLKALGVPVLDAPADRPWGHRDFMVTDPDQNLVWITTPLE